MRVERFIGTVIVCALSALLVATIVEAQPGIGFSKTAPIAGTGSSGSPLRIDGSGCSSDQVLKWSGSAWACAADNGGAGDIEAVTAGIGLEGGATSGTASLSLLSSCSDGQVLKSASSGTAWACANDIDTDSGGDITSVGATSGGGLTGGASSGAALLGLLTTCTTGQGLEWDGDSWECADDDIGSPGAGDIESVAAGDGLTGGGTVGALTLDVGCGTGLSCAADTVTVNISGASCSAGQYMTALSATGGGTCTAEVGDISSVVAGTGLTDGGTSGAVTLNVACGDGLSCAADEVRMRQDCSTNQILKWTGTDWTCQSDVGGGFDTAGDGLTSSSTTVNVVCGSNLACAADSVNLATNVAIAGTATVASTLGVTGVTTMRSGASPSSGQLLVDANATGAVGLFSFQADNNSICFDCFYGSSTWTARDTSVGAIYKSGDALNFIRVSGTSNGANITSAMGSALSSPALSLSLTSGNLTHNHLATMNELTVNSTATFNHHVNLGNTTADDVSIPGTTHAYGNLNSTGAGKPTVSSCGTSPSQPQSNNGGVITVGSGTATSCTVTFYNSGFAAEPACTLTYQDSGTLYISAKSATGFTFARTDGGNMAGEKADFICLGPDAP